MTAMAKAPSPTAPLEIMMRPLDEVLTVACDALRWVARSALACEGGTAWPEIAGRGEIPVDDLYSGTAGVLLAFSEAKLSGVDDFDATASLVHRG